jgi:hypothetical protein
MPRLIFEEHEEFANWVDAHCTPPRYEFYITSYGELIAAPLKATKPTTYAMKKMATDDLKKIKDLLISKGYKVYIINRLDWDTERGLTQ